MLAQLLGQVGVVEWAAVTVAVVWAAVGSGPPLANGLDGAPDAGGRGLLTGFIG